MNSQLREQQQTNRSTQSVEKKDRHIGWAGIQCYFAQVIALKDPMLLDSDSTDTIFCNPKYVKNIPDLGKDRKHHQFSAH